MRVRCVSHSDKDFQFTGIFVWVAHNTCGIERRLRWRDSFVDFFYFASSSTYFLLHYLAVAHVSCSGVGIVDGAIHTAQKCESTKGAEFKFQTGLNVTNVSDSSLM